MGNSTAYPVFRTTDPAEAHARAERLRALLETCEDEVALYAELLTAADVRRMAEVLPGARFDHLDVRTGPEGSTSGSISTRERRRTPRWSRTSPWTSWWTSRRGVRRSGSWRP